MSNNFGNIAIWKEKFPPNSWIMKGIGMINLMDTTIDQSLNSITSNITIWSKDSFNNIRSEIKNLYNNKNIEVGIVSLVDNELVTVQRENVKSILLSNESTLECTSNLCPDTFQKLIADRDPLIIPDVAEYHQNCNTFISQKLTQLNVKSYIIAPLIYEDKLLGFMELSSDKKHELNTISYSCISDIIPVLAMATERYNTEAQNQMEAIIQQECTTIHRSVKWRFEAEAKKFIEKKYNNEKTIFKDIIFKEVYPLFGQLDIKNSSVKRNEAVKADLIRQMHEVKKS